MSRLTRPRIAPSLVVTALLALGACAAPGVLRKPPGGPSMAPPTEGNPLPAYVSPDPSPPVPAQDPSPGIH
jgi:hypothetical protein